MTAGAYPGGEGGAGVAPPLPLKYRQLHIFSQRNSGNRTSKDAMIFFFFWSSLIILGGKLDVERREDLLFWSLPIFSVET